MTAYLALVLHAHLPFVRHPEHDRFLEEYWLYEAVLDAYLPLVQLCQGWARDRVQARLTLSLSPTLNAMLQDGLLRKRCLRYLDERIELAGREIHRTHFEPRFHPLAILYRQRFESLRATYLEYRTDLTAAWMEFQERGLLELITCAGTHPILPFLTQDSPAWHAQVSVALDQHWKVYGRHPNGFWLPECAYVPDMEPLLAHHGHRWLVLESEGLLGAMPKPYQGLFAPVLTPAGWAAFGREPAVARQVWSRQAGYPGDHAYRDYYRDIGFDLDLDYLKPYLPLAERRTPTGVKYHRITGPGVDKQPYDPTAASARVSQHASHFLDLLRFQAAETSGNRDLPPLIMAPFDAELFGHWWYEGVGFLDCLVRGLNSPGQEIQMITPTDYLAQHPRLQAAAPAASSWGEGGYWKVWLNETNAWLQPGLRSAQRRMMELVSRLPGPRAASVTPNQKKGSRGMTSGNTTSRNRSQNEKEPPPFNSDSLQNRALQQAGRELLLAQSSDWAFMLYHRTTANYARQRVIDHLNAFQSLHNQIQSGVIDETALHLREERYNLFPDLNVHYWSEPTCRPFQG
ncbi:MAG TPA: DUF1957 domain-containing protein [Candidatus Paceibacterota bacterium]|nr:DUF1957 domain-containing protein [Verrucomicrobiota bacterium]HRY48772.1 DUF1957 domain-containing protein [Candidatus Paceibacterota bacterium]HSA00901.1 DUF1957 domain-containing protein [Candidatus Paceibacterota bacterium]